MIEFYLKKFKEATKVIDKKNYAKLAGIEFDVGEYIREKYFKEVF